MAISDMGRMILWYCLPQTSGKHSEACWHIIQMKSIVCARLNIGNVPLFHYGGKQISVRLKDAFDHRPMNMEHFSHLVVVVVMVEIDLGLLRGRG